MDEVTWAVLAGVAQAAFSVDVTLILEHAFETMFTVDSPVFEEGCEPVSLSPNPIQGSRVPCDYLRESYLYEGFKFTSDGYGPQWENAGSGSMTLRLWFHFRRACVNAGGHHKLVREFRPVSQSSGYKYTKGQLFSAVPLAYPFPQH